MSQPDALDQIGQAVQQKTAAIVQRALEQGAIEGIQRGLPVVMRLLSTALASAMQEAQPVAPPAAPRPPPATPVQLPFGGVLDLGEVLQAQGGIATAAPSSAPTARTSPRRSEDQLALMENKVLQVLRVQQGLHGDQLAKKAGGQPRDFRNIYPKMEQKGLIRSEGERRGKRYYLPLAPATAQAAPAAHPRQPPPAAKSSKKHK